MSKRLATGGLAVAGLVLGAVLWSCATTMPVPLPDTSNLPVVDIETSAQRQDDIGWSLGAAPLGWPDADLARHLDLAAASGAGWIRIDVDWSDIEDRRGRYDWSTVDRVVRLARERELDVLGLIAYTPGWARPAGSSDKHPPTELDDFAAFAGSAAGRYGNAGAGDLAGSVLHWEIWNEPNIERFWEPGADPEAYAELFAAGAGAIRGAEPGSTIITGGLAPSDDADGDLSPASFVTDFLDAGPPISLIDAVALHPYTFPALPGEDQKWNSWYQMEQVSEALEPVVGGPTPIWITEFGAPTGGRGSVDLERQAEIIQAALACSDRGPDHPLFLYSLADLDSDDVDRESHFGLITSDGRAKPAWDVLLDVTSGGTVATTPCA